MLYRVAYSLFWLILRPTLALLGGFRVEGEEYIPPAGGVILAPNHTSYSDPPIMGLACPRVVWFMTKAPLFKVPLLGPFMRIFHAFPVDPNGVDREALRFSERLLLDGEVLCIFGEGGVSDDGCLRPLKPGLALLALRTQTPIVPVAMIRTHRFLSPRGRFLGYARGGVIVRFGLPLDLTDLPRQASRHEQLAWVTDRLHAAINKLLPPEQQAAA